ncbi:MAG: prepilin-type N-terminal cleavage/methylation domain-containing protein [Candidatus Manganitrophus sp.]|nr:prepilin-type N-terminal cleavage/methylation domain-containing protein [Candidatus Manganitrophus sp.]
MVLNPKSEIDNPQSKGFTLLEILVSLAILAVLFTLVYGSFNATYRVSEQLEEQADSYRLARLGFYHLAKDLSMIYQTKPIPGQPTSPRLPSGIGGHEIVSLFGRGSDPDDRRDRLSGRLDPVYRRFPRANLAGRPRIGLGVDLLWS